MNARPISHKTIELCKKSQCFFRGFFFRSGSERGSTRIAGETNFFSNDITYTREGFLPFSSFVDEQQKHARTTVARGFFHDDRWNAAVALLCRGQTIIISNMPSRTRDSDTFRGVWPTFADDNYYSLSSPEPIGRLSRPSVFSYYRSGGYFRHLTLGKSRVSTRPSESESTNAPPPPAPVFSPFFGLYSTARESTFRNVNLYTRILHSYT